MAMTKSRIVVCSVFLLVAISNAALLIFSNAAYAAVPRASCGPHDRPESGLQGQTTLAERYSSDPAKAYRCNLELVGQFEGEGSAFGLNSFQQCAYYSTWHNPNMRHPGVTVLDVSDSRDPKPTAYLNSPAMIAANESLEIHEARGLLIGNRFPLKGMEDEPFDIYDLSRDCRYPVLITSTVIPKVMSHMGQFSPDGSTFYGASAGATPDSRAPQSAVFAIDVRDPKHPYEIATWIPDNEGWKTHALRLNGTGTRAYLSLYANPAHGNGLVILDITDIQARRPSPKFRVISTLFFDETQFAHFVLPVTIQGRQYLIWTDGEGAIPAVGPRSPDACRSGKPGHGYARIVDIGNESEPRTVSHLMLEVTDPENCLKVVHDPTILGYSSEGCDVDSYTDAKLLACAYYEAGLRVFDIQDPHRPREIAYYKPPAKRTKIPLGSPFAAGPFSFSGSAPADHTADVVAFAKFRKDGSEIWFNSFDNGFQVVRFTEHFRVSNVDRFKKGNSERVTKPSRGAQAPSLRPSAGTAR